MRLSWINTYKFMGKHRHLRRMRSPWFKLKFGILLRAIPVLILMLPILVPYVVLLIDQMINERLLEWYEDQKQDGNIFHKTTMKLGLEALMDREEKISKRVYRWRRKMNVGMPKRVIKTLHTVSVVGADIVLKPLKTDEKDNSDV